MKTVLMATRADRPEHTPEAEAVEIDATDDTVRLVLDDGVTVEFDRRELVAAAEAA